MKTALYLGGIAVLIIGGLYALASKSSGPRDGRLDAFALCLAQKDITMYGAAWCSHCKTQKALFGASFEKVPYVECPENQKLCLDKGVTGYPTWISGDGEKFAGVQSLERLSEISGCELPKED